MVLKLIWTLKHDQVQDDFGQGWLQVEGDDSDMFYG